MPPIQHPAPVLNLLFVGDAGVGKSSFIKFFCEQKVVVGSSTIGIDFGVKRCTIEGQDEMSDSFHVVRLNFYDAAGMDSYAEVRNEFYRDAHVIIVMFSLASLDTFNSVPKWFTEANKFTEKASIALIGNQIDNPRCVSANDVSALIQSNGIKYYETSAFTGENVTDTIHAIAKLAQEEKQRRKSVSAS